MNTHTPGPWDLYSPHPAEQYIDIIEDAAAESYRPLLRIHHDKAMPQQETEANARLIAAAPELLEALRIIGCQSIGDDWTYQQAFEFMKKRAKEAYRAATKAEGRG